MKKSLEEIYQHTYYAPLNPQHDIGAFCSGIDEYDLFLKRDALEYMSIGISNTQLLLDSSNGKIIGYFSLCMAAMKLNDTEKVEHDISHVPFSMIPCLRLGKLAVDLEYKKCGYGSYILELVKGIAIQANEEDVACRFILVDADIQYDKGNLNFYQKNGFIENNSHHKKAESTTVSMRLDIYKEHIIAEESITA